MLLSIAFACGPTFFVNNCTFNAMKCNNVIQRTDKLKFNKFEAEGLSQRSPSLVHRFASLNTYTATYRQQRSMSRFISQRLHF